MMEVSLPWLSLQGQIELHLARNNLMDKVASEFAEALKLIKRVLNLTCWKIRSRSLRMSV